MTGFKRVDHTAIVVADLDEAINRWQALTGAVVSARETVEHQRVEVAILALGDTSLELIRPLDHESGVARFLAKRGESLHHVGIEVADLDEAIAYLGRQGVELIHAQPRHGAHGLIVFLRPQATGGVLLELIEKNATDEGLS